MHASIRKYFLSNALTVFYVKSWPVIETLADFFFSLAR